MLLISALQRTNVGRRNLWVRELDRQARLLALPLVL